MKILLYNPDNGVTRNFMPDLWMFLLQALTSPVHGVILIDGNAQALGEAGLARFVQEEQVGLVGIGALTCTRRWKTCSRSWQQNMAASPVVGTKRPRGLTHNRRRSLCPPKNMAQTIPPRLSWA